MEFQNLIEKRRSVRKYVERNTVTKDEILSMIKAAQEIHMHHINLIMSKFRFFSQIPGIFL